MKKITYALLVILLSMFTACEKDNYDGPNAMLTGKITYSDKTLGLKNGEVSLRLYEPGWELSGSTYITISVAQDGTYSANIFGGKNYELVRVANIGPWKNPVTSDMISFTMKGNMEVNVPVEPFFAISSSTITIESGVVKASMAVNQVDASKTIESVGLYVSPNLIVDANNNKLKTVIDGVSVVDMNNISLSAALTDALKKEKYVFARVGVKTVGSPYLIYSIPIRVDVK